MENLINDLHEAKTKEKISIQKPQTFFHKRLDPLGVTTENNSISIWQNNMENKEAHEDILVPVPVFKEVPEGIEIMVYTIDRLQINYSQKGNKSKKKFSIVRLEQPLVKPDGSEMKYRLPKGAGTHPFFPPALVEKYDKKIKIDTLFMVEGYFKAWKASLSGLDIVGLSSITHMKDTETGLLHADILKIIQENKVKRIVWLTDGDAIDITQKELENGLDLSKRPKGFFSTVTTFKTLLDPYENLEKWFYHIDTDNIVLNNKDIFREDVKGMDDLLIFLPDQEKDIIADILSVQPGNYFQKFNVSYGTGKVYAHFHLRDVKDFYLFHVERRPDLQGKEFIFNGTRYMYNEETGDCDVKIPGAAKLYFRCGDDYYKFISTPNQYHQLERTFQSRKKTTITDDHGSNFVKYVPKYEAFCNVPNHFNFEQIIHNCFNVYSPLDFVPDEEKCTEEDCPTIIKFISHLFGNKTVSYIEPESKKKFEYTTTELALDYLQLLYQNPQQKLPILCLVSKENSTGKSTFANFLRMMLGANTAIVGNADLQSDFNAHWATKSVVICDETKIDKQQVVEKIKNLSTARKIFMNAKGRGQVELDCFIKFVLITNNETTFINVTEDDIRYWVIKVPVLQQENPNILEQIKEEMGFFLSFLQGRNLSTKLENRMWFHPRLLKTEALKRVIGNSDSTVVKEIKHYIKEMFLELPGETEITMTIYDIHREIFNNSTRFSPPYITSELKEKLKVIPYHEFILKGDITTKFITYNEALEAARIKLPEGTDQEISGQVEIFFKSKRYSYPSRSSDGTVSLVNGGSKRPFCFKRSDFIGKDNEVHYEEADLDLDNKSEILKQSDMPF